MSSKKRKSSRPFAISKKAPQIEERDRDVRDREKVLEPFAQISRLDFGCSVVSGLGSCFEQERLIALDEEDVS